MSKSIKPLLIALSVLAAAAMGNVDAALPDAHEQARQLLQRPTAKSHPRFSVARVAPQDAHEQARRLLDRSDVIAEESGTPYEVAVPAVESRDVVDAHARASLLLARPLAVE